MANQEFNRALDSIREVEITVTGRKSGREITLPVWFVREGDRLDLVPVTGTDSNWFKNVMQDPALRVRARGTQITARATPVTDPARVGEILGKFRGKYGPRDVGAYYPKPDAAVEVPLD